MVSKFPEHTSANYFLHTGAGLQGRPSWGAWCGYGLGTGNKDLPTFIILNGGLIPPGGLDNFNSGFLPAAFQGSVFRAANPAVSNISPAEKPEQQKAKLDLIRTLDNLNPSKGQDQIESAIANYETAFRMQAAVPDLMDISKETKETHTLYGLDSQYKPTATFGTQCLIARRLVERGARFIELTCPSVGTDRWDQHNGLRDGHDKNARAVDQPIGALLTDLKRRDLLKDTLVVWGGEFGRTPFAQGGDGRDHNQYGFTMWLAGGGVKGGVLHGETDEFGYKAITDKVEIHDLHATMLHLLGVDHTKQTFRFGGRDMRLTDVHGEVIKSILF
jgi:membrane-anchored protein YejM (alkaline phosphatase superfamily)